MFVSGASANWSRVNPIITGDPEEAVGVYVQVSDTLDAGAGREQMKAMLEGLLPGEIEVTAPVPDRAGNSEATRYDGSLRDRNTGNGLGFVGYVIDCTSAPRTAATTATRSACGRACSCPERRAACN
jgi:hypothetical protein